MQPDVVRSHLASEVRAEMARQSKTQRDLAAVIDVDQGSAGLRLRGERAFRAEELVLVAQWLGVPVARFIPDEVAA
jgi:transcriptional regulator with XRE-family HTH domain